MSRCTRSNASPKSLESVNARPPVSAASDVSVSCDAAELRNCCATPRPEKSAVPRPLAWRRVAAGDDRLQAAGVDRIDGDVGADRGVDRRAQLDLVVLAAALHAGAEVEDRLLLLDRRDSVSASVLSARSRMSLLNMSRSDVSLRRRRRPRRRPRRSRRCWRSAAAWRCLRCSRAWPSAADDLASSAVKSVSTSSVELMVATATMSAGAHLLVDVLRAPSPPRAARRRAASS